MNNFNKNGIYFIPLGGADEIGVNLYAYAVDGKLIVVDVGYGFLNDEYPGIDLSLADASFLENYAGDIEGLFITHAHEDHFGAIAHIWPKLKCPVYATDFTLGLIANRLREYKIEDVPLMSVKDNPVVKLNNFEVEFIPVAHSVPETSALCIRTRYGNVVHATDWRFDDNAIDFLQTDYKALQKAAAEGVEMLVCDSTNILVDNKEPSEFEIRSSLRQLIPTLKNTVVVTCFASNLMRLESLVLAAVDAGRTPVLVGRSLLSNMKIAKECGYFQNLPNCLDVREAQEIPSDKVLYICTGSQANYRSALTFIVNGESKYVKLGKGDTVIFSSKIIPGNEDKIEAMQEKLLAAGVEVITTETHLVHTSGHCSRDEIKAMYQLLKPRVVLPVHGDKKFIRAHKRFAEECGIKEVVTAKNGDIILVNDGKATLVGTAPTDILGVDRRKVISLKSEVIKRRKQIAYNGSVFISVVFREDWGLEGLKISSKDIWEEKEFEVLRDKIENDVAALLPEQVIAANYNEAKIIDFIRVQVRRRINNATDMKPVTFIHFYRIGHGKQVDVTINEAPITVEYDSEAPVEKSE